MIGFSLFPYGWTWDEYEKLIDEDQVSYEREALSASRPQYGEQVFDRSRGSAWCDGANFRKREVESVLKSWLRFGCVPHRFGHRRKNIKVKSNPWRVDDRPIAKEDYDYINIEHSTIGRLVSRQIEIWLEPLSLIEKIITKTEQRGAKQKIDWASIEGRCREEIECERVERNGDGRRRLVNDVANWYPDSPNAAVETGLTNDQVAKQMASLFEEYNFKK